MLMWCDVIYLLSTVIKHHKAAERNERLLHHICYSWTHKIFSCESLNDEKFYKLTPNYLISPIVILIKCKTKCIRTIFPIAYTFYTDCLYTCYHFKAWILNTPIKYLNHWSQNYYNDIWYSFRFSFDRRRRLKLTVFALYADPESENCISAWNVSKNFNQTNLHGVRKLKQQVQSSDARQ